MQKRGPEENQKFFSNASQVVNILRKKKFTQIWNFFSTISGKKFNFDHLIMIWIYISGEKEIIQLIRQISTRVFTFIHDKYLSDRKSFLSAINMAKSIKFLDRDRSLPWPLYILIEDFVVTNVRWNAEGFRSLPRL